MKALGIDIGGGSIKAVYFDNSKIKSFFLRTPQTRKEFEALIGGLILENGGAKLDRIGFGVPGQVSRETLTPLRVSKLPYLKGFNFGKFVRSLKLSKTAVKIDNDVDCCMHAELKFGAARKYKNSVLIAIGSGIGGAIVIDGKIYHGIGSAGEIGQNILDRGLKYEQLAGGNTLRKFDKKELDRVRYYTGIACANIINLLNPEAIILSGGVAFSNSIIPGARKVMLNHIVRLDARKTPITLGEMGEFGGAIGAAWL